MVQIHGSEQYASVPKSTIKKLKDAGHSVRLDDRFKGIIYIEVLIK